MLLVAAFGIIRAVFNGGGMEILVYLLAGAVAGIIAGLFGVGGGIVIVPVLAVTFELLGFAPGFLMQLAVGTSLATIALTSVSAIRSHHRLGNVCWPIVLALAPGLVLGVWLGAQLLARLSGPTLQLSFGVFAMLAAGLMLLNIRPDPSRTLPGRVLLFPVGLTIGGVSALFGIGGGTLTVPYLNWSNVRMQRAVGTSSACGFTIALFGALSAAYVGRDQPVPPGSSGFVYWPAFFGIVLASTLFAHVGARLANRLPAARLKQAFAVFLLLVGLQFIVRNL